MREDLLEMVRRAKPSIAVIGIGGAGSNITTWIAEKGMAGGKIVAANTDASHLSMQKADRVVLLGEKLTRGYGCGGFPERGAEATRESLPEIRQEFEGMNLVFLAAGLGAGTGTGGIPVIASLAREMGILSIACVTIPFKIEMARREKAKQGIKALAENADAVIVIDNERLRQVAGNLPLKDAFGVANTLVGSFVKNVTEVITQPSLINLDHADLRAVMERGGICAIGIGEGDGENRVSKAVSQALATPLLDVPDFSTVYGVLIHIAGGEDMTLDEVATVGEQITAKVPNTKRIIWGARVDPALIGKVHVMAVLTGVTSPILAIKPET